MLTKNKKNAAGHDGDNKTAKIGMIFAMVIVLMVLVMVMVTMVVMMVGDN